MVVYRDGTLATDGEQTQLKIPFKAAKSAHITLDSSYRLVL